ncbi:L,D-transpeptidase family protein [Azonexus sp.]|uniref:L,D-transpeptidase family protein n=1 Tax=Azonexus sp. TaxID=1872668 RepID=UPI0039E557C0
MPKKFWLPLLLVGLAAVIAIPSVIELTTRQTPASAPALVRPDAAAALPVWQDKPPQAAAPSAPAASLPATDAATAPEAALQEIFSAIEAHQLGRALQLTETLIERHPNYRLAHLIKGDLLLARTHPLSHFGAAPGAASEKIADLRAEALRRLQAYREKPATDQIPRYLLQMRPEQRYAVIVDTQRSRLYLYENDAAGGQPRFVADYYVSQGKLGADKFYEGDKKTPLGVYHVTADLSRQKLPDLYGSGAFPINFPNEWDRRRGRGGSGIWLHGTQSDTFARPPLASDGCVVLTNQDLDAVRGYLQVGLTPVIISPQLEWLSPETWAQEREEFARTLETWRSDWESRDTERYLTHYSKQFSADGQDFSRFAAQKRQVNAGKNWIKVKLDKISFFRNPGAEEVIVVSFEQDYRSNNLDNRMKKRQYWVREGAQWKIIYEGAA